MKERLWNPLSIRSAEEREKLQAYGHMLARFNSRINLISRDAAPYIEERHLLHSLALTFNNFKRGSSVVDWGTGGGLPLIPLAICFPEVQFCGVDAVGKKTQAVQTMARRLDLDNVAVWNGRAEAFPHTLHYSVSRATAPLLDLWKWHTRARTLDGAAEGKEEWPFGLLCLKGGDLAEEKRAMQMQFPGVQIKQQPLEPLLGRSYFADKYLLTVTD